MRRDIGAVIFDQEHASLFYADYEESNLKPRSKDFTNLFIKCGPDKDPEPTSDEGKHTYAVWLNSKMENSDQYQIQRNVDPKSGEAVEGISPWRCLYNHIAANTVFVSILGYGDTPEAALQDCDDVREFLQYKYNLGGESV